MTESNVSRLSVRMDCAFCNAPAIGMSDGKGGWFGEVAFDIAGKPFSACEGAECRAKYATRKEATEALRRDREIDTPDGQSKLGIPPEFHGAEWGDKTLGADVKAWYKSAEPGLLLIYGGECGTGKTWLLWATARQAHRDGRPWLAFTVTELFLKLQKAAHDGQTFDMVKGLYMFDGCLLLDDWGAEKPTEFTAMAYYEIISKRIAWRRPTLLTSNMTLKEIERRWGDRFASRMAMGLRLKMAGKDRRLKMGEVKKPEEQK